MGRSRTSATPPASPANAAPPATSGVFALLAALPTVWPALCAPEATTLRASSTRPFDFVADLLRDADARVEPPRPFDLRVELALPLDERREAPPRDELRARPADPRAVEDPFR